MKKAITFVGLDVHSESITVAVLKPGGDGSEVQTLANTAPAVRKAVLRWKAKGVELRCCYEAGPCGFELHRLLTSLGIACEVIASALIPKARRPDQDRSPRRGKAGPAVPGRRADRDSRPDSRRGGSP